MMAKQVDENKSCLNCIWNNDCWIQSALKTYFRHKLSKFKLNTDDFYCKQHEALERKEASENDINATT